MSISQSPVFVQNSRYRHFTATPFCSGRRAITYQGHTYSRSYGVNLPSSLNVVLSRALEFSSHLPVLVYGTGTKHTHHAAFARSVESMRSQDPQDFASSPLVVLAAFV